MTQAISNEFSTREQAQLWIEQRIVRFDTLIDSRGSTGLAPGHMFDVTTPGFKIQLTDRPLSQWCKVERVSSKAFRVIRK